MNDTASWALAVHGGAGTIARESMSADAEAGYRRGLMHALEAGRRVLDAGGHSLDAVEKCVIALEDDPLFNAGRGAVFTRDGHIELDASIMDGRALDCGAVAGVKATRNPISLARRVMTDSPHLMLQGPGADAFARDIGMRAMPQSYFHTRHRAAQLEHARRECRISLDHDGDVYLEPGLGTVGAVARDVHGDLAAATSTGGMTNKMPGRVGDTPIIGAGTYASNRSCAVSATGHGEAFIRATVGRDIAALMEYAGLELEQAAVRKVMRELPALGGEGGIIGVDTAGRLALVFNSSGMYRGRVSAGSPAQVSIFED